jgi:5'-nucleotidase
MAFWILVCASCSGGGRTSEPSTLTLLHTADIHSHLFEEPLRIGPTDAARGLGPEGETVRVGGSARLATLLAAQSAGRAIYLDAGDLFEGTAVYSVFHGVPEMRVMSLLGLDAQAAGNHDLGIEPSRLASLRAGAPFPLLAANLPSEAAVGLVAASALVERGGVTVGVVGIGRGADDAPDLGAAATAVGAALRELAPRADVLVVLSHLGSDLDAELVPRTAGIDVLLGGHTHDVMDPPAIVEDCGPVERRRSGCRPRPVPVVHPGAYGRYLGRVDLVVSRGEGPAGAPPPNPLTGRTVIDARFALFPVTEDTEERADVQALLAPYWDAMRKAGLEDPFAFAPSGLSRTAPRGGDSELGNFVTAAMRAAAPGDVAIVNTTGIRADVPEGTVTLEDVYRVLPFDDELVAADLTADQLGRVFQDAAEASCRRDRSSQVQLDGARVVFGCEGTSVRALSVAGAPVAPSRRYRVLATSFVAQPGQWLGGISVQHSGRSVRDTVIAAVRSLPPCAGGPPLPCLDGTRSSARVDGRIAWQ